MFWFRLLRPSEWCERLNLFCESAGWQHCQRNYVSLICQLVWLASHVPTLWHRRMMYKVVQIWPGQTVTCLHTNSPGHIWTTLYYRTSWYETIVKCFGIIEMLVDITILSCTSYLFKILLFHSSYTHFLLRVSHIPYTCLLHCLLSYSHVTIFIINITFNYVLLCKLNL